MAWRVPPGGYGSMAQNPSWVGPGLLACLAKVLRTLDLLKLSTSNNWKLPAPLQTRPLSGECPCLWGRLSGLGCQNTTPSPRFWSLHRCDDVH